MKTRTYNWDEQERLTKKGQIYKTLTEAWTVAKQYVEYQPVKALDLYTREFIGYTVEHI